MGQIEKYEETPVIVCRKCEQGVWEGEKLYDGMCPDCFSGYIENLLTRDPDRIAEALEPDDPVVMCECTKCRQDIYLDECTFEDGLGNRLCKECFESVIEQRMRDDLSMFATELGYEVVRHV